MINWFNIPDEGLSNGGLFEVKELEVTENGTYETKGEMYNKVTVNVGGGGGTKYETVFEGNVTTENKDDGAMTILEYESVIDADKIKVTFNGTEYECDKITSPVGNGYGGLGANGPDFSEYPFAIISGQSLDIVQTAIYTQSAGTYTLKIEEQGGEESNGFSVMVYAKERTRLYYEADIFHQEMVEIPTNSGVIIKSQPRYTFSIDRSSHLLLEPMAGEFEEVTQNKAYVVNGETLFAIIDTSPI